VAAGPPGAPWVLLLTGLEGSSRSPHANCFARSLVARGIEACILNYRGCSGEPNRLRQAYHSGSTADVVAAHEHLARTRPGRPSAIAGFSFGANLAMLLLGQLGERAPSIALAVALSPPFDLEPCTRHLDRPSGYFYRENFMRSLRAKALAKINRFPGIADARRLAGVRAFRDFDEHFTAPVHGFRDARDYWEKCSGVRYVKSVARDLLIIASTDDPICPAGHIPEKELQGPSRNPRIQLVMTKTGGHLGWVSGSLRQPRFWAEELTLDRLQHAFSMAMSTTESAESSSLVPISQRTHPVSSPSQR
jgi:uncharacterized protein